jgi:hypothetical protein
MEPVPDYLYVYKQIKRAFLSRQAVVGPVCPKKRSVPEPPVIFVAAIRFYIMAGESFIPKLSGF